MSNVLVFGGTKFFGRKLVELLHKNGHSITVATRGNQELNFKFGVNHMVADRANIDDLLKIAQNSYDIIFDQLCFSSKDAELLSKTLLSKTKRYVYVSSQFVYDKDRDINEKCFVPETYPMRILSRNDDVDYVEGKDRPKLFGLGGNFPYQLPQ